MRRNLLTAALISVLLTSHGPTLPESSAKAAPPQAANEPTEPSPRLRELETRVARGDQTALRRFWQQMAVEHTPLIEPVPDAPEKLMVTFLWRAAPGTTKVMVAGRPMVRLLDTDLWYATLMMDRNVPIFYSIFPEVAGQGEKKCADPLNPHRFALPAEVQAAVPPDAQSQFSEWMQTSILFLPAPPAARWAEIQSGVQKGTVKMVRVEDKSQGRSRRIWVYTPAHYSANTKAPYKLLICFDGISYLAEIPVPTILNNLVASDKIWPTVAVLVDNGSAKASAEDLDNHKAFADFIGKELVPWVRDNYSVSKNPADTIVCGYSRGGLAAAYVAWRYPAVIGNVLAQSGAFWRGNEGGVDNPEWLTQQFRHTPKLNTRFYLDVGALETGKTPGGPVFLEANRRLSHVLEAKGYKVRYIEVPGARHDPLHWRNQLADGLVYLAGKR